MSKTVLLSKPIQAHGKEVMELTLRLPTGKDLRTCGVPYKITADQEISIEGSAMHRMIAQLSAVPPSSIDQLAASDWNAVAQEVLGFIMAEQATPTTTANPLDHHEGH